MVGGDVGECVPLRTARMWGAVTPVPLVRKNEDTQRPQTRDLPAGKGLETNRRKSRRGGGEQERRAKETGR